MNHIKLLALLVLSSIILVSCKKNIEETAPSPLPEAEVVTVSKDSISFSINEKQYVFDDKYSSGFANRAVNVKPSSNLIDDGKLAYTTGGYYWYGEKDSTLYGLFYSLHSNQHPGDFKISFNKKFKDNLLMQRGYFFILENHLEILKLGKQSFAVDLHKENTMDGIAIDFRETAKSATLTSTIPGFSIVVRSSLKNDIQNNSSFEITKVEKLKENYYLIEAKFELNLFDEDEHIYKLKNGFLRLKIDVN